MTAPGHPQDTPPARCCRLPICPVDMRIDMCIDMRIDMCIGMRIDMCIDMRIDMCIGMRVDMCISSESTCA